MLTIDLTSSDKMLKSKIDEMSPEVAAASEDVRNRTLCSSVGDSGDCCPLMTSGGTSSPIVITVGNRLAAVVSAFPGSPSDDAMSILFYVYYYGLLGLLSLVNLAGNTAVIQALLRHRHLRVPGNYFIFSIACSDLSLGLIYPVYNVSHIEIEPIRKALGE